MKCNDNTNYCIDWCLQYICTDEERVQENGVIPNSEYILTNDEDIKKLILNYRQYNTTSTEWIDRKTNRKITMKNSNCGC